MNLLFSKLHQGGHKREDATRSVGLLKWCQLLGHLQRLSLFSHWPELLPRAKPLWTSTNLTNFRHFEPFQTSLDKFRPIWASLDQFEVLPKFGHFQRHFSSLAQNLFDFVTLSRQKCMNFVNLSWKIHSHITWGRCYQ